MRKVGAAGKTAVARKKVMGGRHIDWAWVGLMTVALIYGIAFPSHTPALANECSLGFFAKERLREQSSTNPPRISQFGARVSGSTQPSLSIEPFVRTEVMSRVVRLRPVILSAAERHHQPSLSGMTTEEFAEVMLVMLFNEQNGWFEDAVEPVRVLTPLYQQAQVLANHSGLSNFSVWPTNLRPSVAAEILYQEIPLPSPTHVMTAPLVVQGSRISGTTYGSQRELFRAITNEICDDELAIEYLAVNLERGIYRAHREGVAVTWRTLAGWHNQGIVHPEQIRANHYAHEYVYRASAYLPLAREVVAGAKAERMDKKRAEAKIATKE